MSIPLWASTQVDLRAKIKAYLYTVYTKFQKGVSIYPNTRQEWWDDVVEAWPKCAPFYLLTGYEFVYTLMRKDALYYVKRIMSSGNGYHGFWKNGASGDNEHFIEGVALLGALAYLRPGDVEVVRALEDIVEHCIIPLPDYPQAHWCNSYTGHMRSVGVGTQSIKPYSSAGNVDWPFNLGFVKMALAAHYATQRPMYMDWVCQYLDAWMAAIGRTRAQTGNCILPWEVRPDTGQIGDWMCPAVGKGWGYQNDGVGNIRDMRGAFLDTYEFTGNRKYLQVIKDIVAFLFSRGWDNKPAAKYDMMAKKWILANGGLVAPYAVHASLADTQLDPEFDKLLYNWHPPDMILWLEVWKWLHGLNNLSSIEWLLYSGRAEAKVALDKVTAMSVAPYKPDDFPKVRGMDILCGTAFGMVTNNRGELPCAQVIYYKEDGSLGLYDDVAALIGKTTATETTVILCNTATVERRLFLQHGYLSDKKDYVILPPQSDKEIILKKDSTQPPVPIDQCEKCGLPAASHHPFVPILI